MLRMIQISTRMDFMRKIYLLGRRWKSEVYQANQCKNEDSDSWKP